MQEFTVDNKIIVTIHSEILRKLHAWHTDFERVLKRIVSITYELDILWDPSVSSALNKDDSLLVAACVFFELSSFEAGSSRRLALPPPPWFQRDALVLILDYHYDPIEMVYEGSPHSTGSIFSHQRGNDEDITPFARCYSTLVYFEFTCFLKFCF